MRELVWRYDPDAPTEHVAPETYEEARHLLAEGNRRFVHAFGEGAAGTRQVVDLTPADLGLPDSPGAPVQQPFASVLACSDARAPVELILGQRVNSVFVVRVAGNVIGPIGFGSLDYAVTNLGSVKVQVVMGHTHCGAVGAAVDAYLDPDKYFGLAGSTSLQLVVERILGPVRAAALSLASVYGPEVSENPSYGDALLATSVVANTAATAHALDRLYATNGVKVLFTVYDLGSRRTGVPLGEEGWTVGLVDAPTTAVETNVLIRKAAAGRYVCGILEGAA